MPAGGIGGLGIPMGGIPAGGCGIPMGGVPAGGRGGCCDGIGGALVEGGCAGGGVGMLLGGRMPSPGGPDGGNPGGIPGGGAALGGADCGNPGGAEDNPGGADGRAAACVMVLGGLGCACTAGLGKNCSGSFVPRILLICSSSVIFSVASCSGTSFACPKISERCSENETSD